MNKILTIQAFPRIHITLIGLNDNDYRIYGGIGFSINIPVTNISCEISNKIKVIDKREKHFTKYELEKLCLTLKNVKNKCKLKAGISCTIESEVFPHYGLGSGTSIYLSCIEALFLLNDASYDKDMIVELSKRGKASGIGINTYFNGGFVFDIGIKNHGDLIEPSSFTERKGKEPLVLINEKLPDWKIGICIPSYIKSITQKEESNYFKQFCPIDKSFVLDILYESLYGVTSAIKEKDYDVFCKSINKIQKTKWKEFEKSLHGQKLSELEKIIEQVGADCVGMSSLGPALFFLSKNIDDMIIKLSNEIKNAKFYVSNMNNQGRNISYA